MTQDTVSGHEELEDLLRLELDTCDHIGTGVYWLEELPSTMRYAKERSGRLMDGSVIIADHQTDAKGRYERRWHSPKGGVWLSYYLHGDIPNPSLLSIAAGLAVQKTISEYNISCSVKWVNDVHVHDRKIAGILIEGTQDYNVVGIGINTNFEDFDWTVDDRMPKHLRGLDGYEVATSTRNELGKDIDNFAVISGVTHAFDYWLGQIRQGHSSPLIENFRRICDTVGKKVMVFQHNTHLYDATAQRILDNGQLFVTDTSGKQHKLMDHEVYYPNKN
jgi:BirA family biotin operon repressor/biotin-[acetyl-CoA-carboxylase] ligase